MFKQQRLIALKRGLNFDANPLSGEREVLKFKETSLLRLFAMKKVALILCCANALTPPAVQTASVKEIQSNFEDVVQSTYGRYPITMTRGKGCELYDDVTGKSYLDFVAGIATCCLGHGDDRLATAVADQMRKVHHVSNLYYIPEQGDLARWLASTLGGDYRAFFCNSGGEANEAALKLAFKYATTTLEKKSPVILTAHGSFHGRTMATISATAQPKYHGPEGCWKLNDLFDHFEYNDIDSLKLAFDRSKSRGVAAVLIEPLQGEGGVINGDPTFFQELRQLCDDTGALLMFDEVQCGVGRTGKMWGHQHFPNVKPDVLTCAKAIGGGVPLGAMLAARHCDVFTPGDHATTYGGNPLACAAGLAVASAIDNDGLIDNARDRGDQLSAGLYRLVQDFPDYLLDVRGRGLLKGLHLAPDIPASRLVSLCADDGLLLVPAGPDVVRFVPPLVVSELQIDAAIDILSGALAKLNDLPDD